MITVFITDTSPPRSAVKRLRGTSSRFLRSDVTPKSGDARLGRRAALTNDQIKPRKCYMAMREINDPRRPRRQGASIALTIARNVDRSPRDAPPLELRS